MALETTYGSPTAIAITVTSLADGSWRQSAAVDNSTNKHVDALVGGSIQVGTSPTAGDKINIYAYGAWDASNYTAGASGSDAAYTADGEEGLLKLLEVIEVDATSDQDYSWGPVGVAQAFDGVLPDSWGVIVNNESGATLNATGTNNQLDYVGVKYTNA